MTAAVVVSVAGEVGAAVAATVVTAVAVAVLLAVLLAVVTVVVTGVVTAVVVVTALVTAVRFSNISNSYVGYILGFGGERGEGVSVNFDVYESNGWVIGEKCITHQSYFS